MRALARHSNRGHSSAPVGRVSTRHFNLERSPLCRGFIPAKVVRLKLHLQQTIRAFLRPCRAGLNPPFHSGTLIESWVVRRWTLDVSISCIPLGLLILENCVQPNVSHLISYVSLHSHVPHLTSHFSNGVSPFLCNCMFTKTRVC